MLNPNDPSSLAKAAYDCDFHQIHQLIEAGADINAVGPTGTALYAAVLNGDADVVNYLLSLGANPNIPFNGVYPIHLAIDTELQIVKNTSSHPKPLAFITYVLLLAGADVNAVSPTGETPLKMARYRGHKQATVLLEARGAVEHCVGAEYQN